MKIVDLRSDTVTQPTAAMKAAMLSAPLGDDVFGDDPSVLALQERIAAELGKEAALFVPSGTMANQLALRAHTQAGDEVIAHEGCHILNYESAAGAALAGIQLRVVASTDGSLPTTAVQGLIHQTDDPHYAPTRLICFENTHNSCGGCVVPEDNVAAVTELARSRDINTHLDGARLYNAAIASGRPISDLATPFDTVAVCFSKGLGAPVGSALVGSQAAIARAYRFRKMYGGGMRQAGILAAAALHALDHHVTRLSIDHERARILGEELVALGALVDLERVHTNIVYYGLPADHPMTEKRSDGEMAMVAALREAGVLVTGRGSVMRAVMHLGVDDEAFERTLTIYKRLLA